MIKTLRITSVLVAIMAVIFVALPVISGVRSDKDIENFLNSPSVVDTFRDKAGSDKSNAGRNQISPLVKQAGAFALYLNPPKTQPSKPRKATNKTSPRPRDPVSNKFDLIATSYYALRPEMSLALIKKSEGGLDWVRQSSRVGHLIIEQVKDGVVVIRDGERTFELAAERPEKINLVKSSSFEKNASKLPQPGSSAARDKVHRKRASTISDRGRQTTSAAAQPSPEESRAMMANILEMMKSMQTNTKADKSNSQAGTRDSTSIQKAISNLEAMRVRTEEARRLERLGEELK